MRVGRVVALVVGIVVVLAALVWAGVSIVVVRADGERPTQVTQRSTTCQGAPGAQRSQLWCAA